MTDEKMTPNPLIHGASRQDWLDFADTVSLLVDLATARHRRTTQAVPAAPSVGNAPDRRYRFQPLAAATAAPPLPSRESALTDTSRTLGLWAEPVDADTLRLSLQARGLAAINGVANRWATVASADRVVYVSLHFDRKGRAECDLPDDAETRAALATALEVTVPSVRFNFENRDGGDDDAR